MAWSSAADVLAKTGATVTEAQVAIAQGMIESVIGRTEADAGANIKARDARQLGHAVAYQAAYVAANPALLEVGDLSSVSQPDLSVTFRDGGGDTPGVRLISPMA